MRVEVDTHRQNGSADQVTGEVGQLETFFTGALFDGLENIKENRMEWPRPNAVIVFGHSFPSLNNDQDEECTECGKTLRNADIHCKGFPAIHPVDAQGAD